MRCLICVAILFSAIGTGAKAQSCTELVLDSTEDVSAYSDTNTTFTSATAVSNYFGSGDNRTTMASTFFTVGNPCGSSATLKFIRAPFVGARANIIGGNLGSGGSSTCTTNSNCTWVATGLTVGITSQSQTWTSGTFSLVSSFLTSASNLTTAINGSNNVNLPIVARTTGSTVTSANCTFTGNMDLINLNVTTNGTGSFANGPPVGSQICDGTIGDASCTGGHINDQENLINSVAYENNNTTQNAQGIANLETYSMFLRQTPILATETITAYWQVLTVGSVTSGTVAVGQQLEDGSALSATTCVIWANLTPGGSGQAGSTWLVACENPAQSNIASESINLSVCSLQAKQHTSTPNDVRRYIEVNSNDWCPFGSTALSYLTGSTASTMLLSSGSTGASNDPNGQIQTSATTEMNNILAIDSAWNTFLSDYNPTNLTSSTNYDGGPAMPFGVNAGLVSWALSQTAGTYFFILGFNGVSSVAGELP